MITFKQLEKYEYQLNCSGKPPLIIPLLRRNTISKKYINVISSVEAISELIGKMFDEHIFSFVSDYQKCVTEDDRYGVLNKNVKKTLMFSVVFVGANRVDYSGFVDETKMTDGSIFFDTNDVKKIAKLSLALKIYALVLNSDLGLTREKIRGIYHQLLTLLKADQLTARLFQLTKSIALYENKYNYYEEEDIDIIILKAFNFISYNGLIINSYKTNPIPFFAGIVKKYINFGWKYKIDNIYDFTDDDIIDDDLSRKESTEKKLVDKFTLKRLYYLSSLQLSDIHKYHNKKTSEIIEKIKYKSFFWDAILIDIFSKSAGISLKRLRKISPQQAMLLSYYLAIKLNRIFDQKYKNLFELAYLFPTNEPKYRNYRLKNVSQFLNATIQLTMMQLFNMGGSRIFIVRLIEDILGKIKSTPFCKVSTGELIGNIDTDVIEKELIEYILRYFTTGFKKEFEGIKNVISKEFKSLKN